MDDVILPGHISTVASDVEEIVAAMSEIGLKLNPSKCEIVAQDFKIILTYKVFAHFN